MLVFVYGTLTDPDRVDAVVDDWSFVDDAVLEGLVRAEGRYPTLVPPTGTTSTITATTTRTTTATAGAEPRVEGRLLRTSDVDALDDYEGVARDLYVRVPVPVEHPTSDGDDRPGEAVVYVGDPARLGTEGNWPGPGTFPERVRRYVDEHDVAVHTATGR